MSKFEKRFFTVLREQTAEERAAMEASLDDDTNPEEFDTKAPSSEADSLVQQASQIKSRQAEEMKNQIDEWTTRCLEFKDFLNDTNPGSISYALSVAVPKTIFDDMKTSQLSAIRKVAEELAKLAEAFKGYSAKSNDAQYKFS
jgi:phosphomevalonate kinase